MILDTNALSAFADGDLDIQPILTRAVELAIPVIVLGEYSYGIAQSRLRLRYESWLADLTTACRILSINQATAIQYAKVRDELKRIGQPIPANDVWIAAIAREHKMPLLSRDRHFDAVQGLKRIAW